MSRSLPDSPYQSTATFPSCDLHHLRRRKPHVLVAISSSVDSVNSAKREHVQSDHSGSLCKSWKISMRNDSDYYHRAKKQQGHRMRTIPIDLCQHQSTSRFQIKSRLNHVSTADKLGLFIHMDMPRYAESPD